MLASTDLLIICQYPANPAAAEFLAKYQKLVGFSEFQNRCHVYRLHNDKKSNKMHLGALSFELLDGLNDFR